MSEGRTCNDSIQLESGEVENVWVVKVMTLHGVGSVYICIVAMQ